ncbi:MAG: hypothetical protein Q9162_002965 [Coniocarpon cinnabarinum]
MSGLSRWWAKHKPNNHFKKRREDEDAQREAQQPQQAAQGPAAPKTPAAPAIPFMNKQPMGRDFAYESSQAAGAALSGTPYAVIGGANGLLNGGTRGTLDLDLIVKRGASGGAKQQLGGASAFTNKSNRLWYTKPHSVPPKHSNVDVVEAHQLYHSLPDFNPDTDVVMINGIPTLKPELMATYKVISYQQRRADQKWDKAQNDGNDLVFWLRFMVEHNIHPNGHLRQYADADFIGEFEGSFPQTKELFKKLGLSK